MSQTQHARTPNVILAAHLSLPPPKTHTIQLHVDTQPCISGHSHPQHTRVRHNLRHLDTPGPYTAPEHGQGPAPASCTWARSGTHHSPQSRNLVGTHKPVRTQWWRVWKQACGPPPDTPRQHPPHTRRHTPPQLERNAPQTPISLPTPHTPSSLGPEPSTPAQDLRDRDARTEIRRASVRRGPRAGPTRSLGSRRSPSSTCSPASAVPQSTPPHPSPDPASWALGARTAF